MLHYHYVISAHIYLLTVSFNGAKTVWSTNTELPYAILRGTKFRILLPFQVALSQE